MSQLQPYLGRIPATTGAETGLKVVPSDANRIAIAKSDDDLLWFDLIAGRTYRISGHMIFSPVTSSAGDLSFNFQMSTGSVTSAGGSVYKPDSDSNATNFRIAASTSTEMLSSYSRTVDMGYNLVTVEIIPDYAFLVATDGRFAFAWGCPGASVGNTLLAGSWMRCERIS